MNSWNFNEVTQRDILDYKACKHNQTGEIYGIKDSSTCQSGKEIDKKELDEMVKKANAGDAKAKKELEAFRKARAEGDQKTKKEKAEKEAAKKKAEEDGKKSKKGGKGKKGGGKGKKGGGKGKKGGGKAKGGGKGKGGGAAKPAAKASDSSQQKQQARKAAMDRARDTVKRLQKMMREVTDPKARQQIQKAIGDLMKSVVDAAKADMGTTSQPGSEAGKVQGQVKSEASKNEKQ